MRRLAAALLLALPAAAGDYAVLSGVGETDPYYPAAAAIAQFHKTTDIVLFDPEHPEEALARLRELKPAQVAIVVRPEQIDVSSVQRFIKVAAQVDEDPFVDFNFGFITGATAAEAVKFVENIVRASKQKHPLLIGQARVGGPIGPCKASNGQYVVGSLRFQTRELMFNPPDDSVADDPFGSRDQKFIDKNLGSLAGCGAIMFGGHGVPWELIHGPRAEDIARVNLFPAVAYNYACSTGVTLKWSGGTIAAEKSFALMVIRAGATGYVGYVNPRPGGPELEIDFRKMLAGATLGEARRQDYAKVTLGYLGFKEKGIVAGDVKEEQPRTQGVDLCRDALDWAVGGILYGDPAMRPYTTATKGLPTVETTRNGAAIQVTFKVPADSAGVWCYDKFVRAEKGIMRKVTDRIELPAGFDVDSATVVRATQGNIALTTLPVLFAEETDRGKRYLQIKVNFQESAMPSAEVEVRIMVKGH